MSGAVTLFLKQCVMRGGLPFAVEIPSYSAEVLDAMREAKILSRDPAAKRYGSFREALEDIEDEV